MATIELTTAEQDILGQTLQSALANLEIEIRHADHLEFKEFLKERRQVLQQLREKLETSTVEV